MHTHCACPASYHVAAALSLPPPLLLPLPPLPPSRSSHVGTLRSRSEPVGVAWSESKFRRLLKVLLILFYCQLMVAGDRRGGRGREGSYSTSSSRRERPKAMEESDRTGGFTLEWTHGCLLFRAASNHGFILMPVPLRGGGRGVYQAVHIWLVEQGSGTLSINSY